MCYLFCYINNCLVLTLYPVFQPWQSPYNSMDGNPIMFNDVRGLSVTNEDGTETVEKGDNLGTIAKKRGVNVNDLYEKNKDVIGDDIDLIKPGQRLEMPEANEPNQQSSKAKSTEPLNKQELRIKQKQAKAQQKQNEDKDVGKSETENIKEERAVQLIEADNRYHRDGNTITLKNSQFPFGLVNEMVQDKKTVIGQWPLDVEEGAYAAGGTGVFKTQYSVRVFQMKISNPTSSESGDLIPKKSSEIRWFIQISAMENHRTDILGDSHISITASLEDTKEDFSIDAQSQPYSYPTLTPIQYSPIGSTNSILLPKTGEFNLTLKTNWLFFDDSGAPIMPGLFG